MYMSKVLKLSQYAKMMGVHYVTAFRWFKNGKIENAFQRDTGTIFVTVPENDTQKPKINKVLIYCRVSNNSRRPEMEFQVQRCIEFANARGLQVHKVFKEVASGMNDNRPKLWEMLDSEPTTIIVENKDRLTRFGFTYIEKLLKKQNCEIIVMNPNKDDEQDLMKDFIAIITSFCCRLYGLRRMKNKLDKIKIALNIPIKEDEE
jgi:putative resolvase